jgi:hypothetical protein
MTSPSSPRLAQVNGAQRGISELRAEYSHYRESVRWQTIRRAVKLRANGKCEICRRADGVQCAHLTYERIFHEPLTDLVWVCAPCHGKLDGNEAAQLREDAAE